MFRPSLHLPASVCNGDVQSGLYGCNLGDAWSTKGFLHSIIHSLYVAIVGRQLDALATINPVVVDVDLQNDD